MKKQIILLLILSCLFYGKRELIALYISEKTGSNKRTPVYATNEQNTQTGTDFLWDELFAPGIQINKIMLWGGFHKHLYGYIDQRYRKNENDDNQDNQGDYISLNSQYYGLELYITDFSNIVPDLKDLKFGTNIAGYQHGEIKQRTLYSVPLHNIPEETVPNENEPELNGKIWANIGVFVGLDKKWIELDIGVTLITTIVEEKKREKLDPNSDPENPTYIKTEGRGLLFDEGKVRLNALFRLGQEKKPHMTISAYRHNYDPVYGAVMGKVCIPLFSFIQFNIGGHLWQTQSIFIEPLLIVKGVALGVMAGVILNYQEKELERVGLEDSIFYSCSISYMWK